MSKGSRPCIEVDARAGVVGSVGTAEDPIGLFVHMLRVQNRWSDDVEGYNRRLLESLIQKGQIPKTSIIWHDDKISKIYGFRLGQDGRIKYDTPRKGSTKTAREHATTDPPKIDVLSLQNAILRSKQMAI